MEEDIKSFLDYLASEKKYSKNTLAAYHNDLNQLADYVKSEGMVAGRDPSEPRLNAELLSGYLHSLRGRKYKSSTVARKIAAAKSFLKFMVDRGKLRGDLAPTLASPQVSKPLPKPLSVVEVRRLLSEPAKLSTIDAKRDKAMMELLYATGLRASELMALNTRDIDLRKNTVRCSGSGSRVRVVPIDPPVTRLVKEYIDVVRPDLLSDEKEVALFLNRRGERLTRQGFWQIIQGYADKVGLSGKVTPRSLRHSFAAHKLKSGADLEVVQELLGHAHISTTRAYTQVELRP
ncbi:MAG: tyrosine-type recombinase/integrase [Dehalococcoidia bacterium]|nr:tyrosine-type recombinase/integrase [Dehalococcoidia bacterium]